MVAMLLDIVANPIFGRDQAACIAALAQARVAHRFLERGIEAGDGIGEGRRIMGQFGKLVARHSKVAEQGVAENLGELVGPGSNAPGGSEGADVDLVDFRQLEQQARGHRPLVALEVIEIARTDAKRRGHVGLRQFMVAAKAAQTVAEEELGRGHKGLLSI